MVDHRVARCVAPALVYRPETIEIGDDYGEWLTESAGSLDFLLERRIETPAVGKACEVVTESKGLDLLIEASVLLLKTLLLDGSPRVRATASEPDGPFTM